MRRTIDEAFRDLQEQVGAWALGHAKPGLRVFVYPPEWEPVMLSRFCAFADECSAIGRPISLVDVGQAFLAELERRARFVERLAEVERESRDRLLHDLGVIGRRAVEKVLTEPLEAPAVCRVLINTGALGTFVSYSAIANSMHTDAGGTAPIANSVLAFPGEDDQLSLNLLRLRVDTSYRIPRS